LVPPAVDDRAFGALTLLTRPVLMVEGSVASNPDKPGSGVPQRGLVTVSRRRVGAPIIAGKGKRLTNAWILSIGPERSYALDEQIDRLVAN